MNALAAIEQYVAGPHGIGLDALRAGLAADDPDLRERCLAAPKWGNDDPRVDRWMRHVNRLRTQVCERVAARHGVPAIPVCHVVRSLHHVDGARIGATPDGRESGEALADSIELCVGPLTPAQPPSSTAC